jgi:hypothetical protein
VGKRGEWLEKIGFIGQEQKLMLIYMYTVKGTDLKD